MGNEFNAWFCFLSMNKTNKFRLFVGFLFRGFVQFAFPFLFLSRRSSCMRIDVNQILRVKDVHDIKNTKAMFSIIILIQSQAALLI